MPDYTAHSSAVIDTPCQIGKGTQIWHFCHIMTGAVIGENCVLGQNVFVADGAIIGDNVKIQNNVSVYRGCVLEDGVFLGPGCVLTNVINPRAEIERKSDFKTTRIGRGATVGANATVVCGVTIGEFAFIGAGAVVTRNVPCYALITGVPGRQQGSVCKCGEKLIADSTGQDEVTRCLHCQAEYAVDGISVLPMG
jgi:UDP-2-acetamido-3-amino-2,3-dideoxy-glucuronate N-acetyltransferase